MVGGEEASGPGDAIPYGMWDTVQLSGQSPDTDLQGEQLLLRYMALELAYSKHQPIEVNGSISRTSLFQAPA